MVAQPPFDLSASPGGDVPPPVMFRGDAPEARLERAQRSDLWTRIGPPLTALALLVAILVVCLLLGYAFGKIILGA